MRNFHMSNLNFQYEFSINRNAQIEKINTLSTLKYCKVSISKRIAALLDKSDKKTREVV